MIKIRNNKICIEINISIKPLVMILVFILTCAITAGSTFGVLSYASRRSYHEEAIPCKDLLDKPDGITVYYVEDGCEKSQKLSKKEIDLVFTAFQEMGRNCIGAKTAPQYHNSLHPHRELTSFEETRKQQGGAVEFHYKQRREVQIMFSPPKDTPVNGFFNPYYSFWGHVDSLSVAYMDQAELYLVGCLNDAYYVTAGHVKFSQESTDNFWSVVKSCI